MKRVWIAAIAFALCIAATPGWAKIVYVNCAQANDSGDGLSWEAAKKTITSGLNVSVSGDEVWVARGTYVERIALKANVSLYGGFSGSETEQNQRNWRTNVVVLDGARGGNVVTADNLSAARIDGFTIRNGIASLGGGGVRSYFSSITIANNTITGNSDGGNSNGGGVSCTGYGTTPTVVNNIIGENSGSGINCGYSSTPTIAGNFITRNSGAGISSYQSSAAMINNTIAGNSSVGISCGRSPASVVANNIIAFNASGVYAGYCTPAMRNNCFYGNPGGDYLGVGPGANDIHEDPKFANWVYDVHIQPESGCRNAGDNSAVQPGWVDIDGDPRVLPLAGGTVDIGADESDGTTYHYTALVTFAPGEGVFTSPVTVSLLCGTEGATIRYTTDGTLPDESQPGVSSGFQLLIDRSTTITAMASKEGIPPSAPKKAFFKITGTVAAPTFSLPAGHYNSAQTIVLGCATPQASIHFTTDGSEPTASAPVFNQSQPIVLNRGMTVKAAAFLTDWIPSAVSTANYTMRAPSVLHVNANATSEQPDGLSWATAFTSVSPALSGAIVGDEVWVARGTYVERITLRIGVALYGGFSGSETGRDQRDWRANATTIDANKTGSVVTAPVGCTASTIIDGFKITRSADHGTMSAKSGLFCDGSSPTISHNIIFNNVMGVYAPGGSPLILYNEVRANASIAIYCTGSQGVIASNYIAMNGGGVCLDGSTATVANNTIVGNGSAKSGLDAYTSPAAVSNNIIAFNAVGVSVIGTAPLLKNNCVFGNTSRDYSGITDQTGINGNIKADPKLANYVCDPHIQPNSPCKDSGSNAQVQTGWTDIDGQPRTQPSGGVVDIGADESDGTVHVVVDTPQFSPPGGPLFAPGNVSVTCSTPDATVHYTTNGAEPTLEDPTIASGAFVMIDHALTLKARASKMGLIDSLTKTASYSITGFVVAPTIDLPGGSYETGQYVTISCADSAASIRYTTDGRDPVETDTLLPKGTPVYIGRTLTLKARAFKQDWGPSPVASADYVFRPARTIYVRNNPMAATKDGHSWDTAYATIGDALGSTVSGDQIWVAEGVYTECIGLAPDIAVYGGFAGSESSADQRNPKTHTTVIDGDAGGSVVTAGVCVGPSTVVDGFTVRNGNAAQGGGFFCVKSSPTISHDVISGCTALSGGGAVYCQNGSPVIEDNMITGCSSGGDGAGVYLNSCPGGRLARNTISRNKASIHGGAVYCYSESTFTAIVNNKMVENVAMSGSAVYCAYSSPKISGNLMCGNAGEAIYLFYSSSLVANNTLVGNGHSAVAGYSGSPSFVNDLIAFNEVGVSSAPTGWGFRNNCIFGNEIGNYVNCTDRTGQSGNISVEPKLASAAYGNLHIQADSPCRDVGDNSVVLGGDLDIDGQPRVQGTRVDIGADESDLTVWNHVPSIVRVSQEGNDANDGSSWELAKRTVQSAIDAACVGGGDVWVKAGTYNELITLYPYAYLFGGFKGNETERSQRDWDANKTILDGQHLGSVVTVQTGCFTTTVDGFTITNGRSQHNGGGIQSTAPTTISNNTITGNAATNGGYGGGVYSFAMCRVYHNTISGNTALSGGGLFFSGWVISVVGNTISSNSATGNGGGATIWSYCRGQFTGNLVVGNSAVYGGGLHVEYSYPTIAFNTIAQNNAATDGGGITCFGNYDLLPQLVCNTVAFNSSGLYGVRYTEESINNCVHGNKAYNYMYGREIGPSDFSLDPLFADRAHGDYHLLPGSPCIDAGVTAGAPVTDLDSNPRPKDGNGDGVAKPDIGCYEAPANYATLAGAKGFADGLPAGIANAVVTAAMPGRFYVETANRITGIGILGSAPAVGRRITVEGTMATIDGERMITPTWIRDNGIGKTPAPWLMNSNTLGGGPLALQAGVSDWRLVRRLDDQGNPYNVRDIVCCGGANNIGLLIKTVGRVSYVDDSCFYVDGGGIFDDGTESIKGVRVLRLPGIGYVAQVGDNVVVTGISSCLGMESTGHYARLIRPVAVEALASP